MMINPIGQMQLVNQVAFLQQELTKANAEITYLRKENLNLKTKMEKLNKTFVEIKEEHKTEIKALKSTTNSVYNSNSINSNRRTSSISNNNNGKQRNSTRKSRRLSSLGKELFKNNKFKLAVEEIIEEKKIIDAFTTNANGRPHSKSYQEYLDYYT